jgi:hypothetical protein
MVLGSGSNLGCLLHSVNKETGCNAVFFFVAIEKRDFCRPLDVVVIVPGLGRVEAGWDTCGWDNSNGSCPEGVGILFSKRELDGKCMAVTCNQTKCA